MCFKGVKKGVLKNGHENTELFFIVQSHCTSEYMETKAEENKVVYAVAF